MKEISSKEIDLASVIRSELVKFDNKMKFWNVDCVELKSPIDENCKLSLTDVLECIDPAKDFQDSQNFALLYGIAWEFIWGERPPIIVTELRNSIIEKAKTGLNMSDLELLWCQLIYVETDLF